MHFPFQAPVIFFKRGRDETTCMILFQDEIQVVLETTGKQRLVEAMSAPCTERFCYSHLQFNASVGFCAAFDVQVAAVMSRFF